MDDLLLKKVDLARAALPAIPRLGEKQPEPVR
jgi:hypothetical protein